MKCDLPLKTIQREGIPTSSVWLRVAIPSVKPFTQATSSEMGGRSVPPDTPHENWRWSREISTTFPEGAVGEGAGRAAPTPAATTSYSAYVKAWITYSDIPKATSPCDGGGPVGYPPPPCVA